jgi:hypothetical protein
MSSYSKARRLQIYSGSFGGVMMFLGNVSMIGVLWYSIDFYKKVWRNISII